MCWSGGKDSAMALQAALADPALRVEALLTTVTDAYERISMHGVRRALLHRQAAAIGLPVEEVRIPTQASNAHYEEAMGQLLNRYRAQGVRRVIFGDLFLQDIRRYRERQLARLGMEGLFPLWLRNTKQLADGFIAAGFRAILVCVDPRQLPSAFCGRDFDATLLRDLPPGVDPCGEHGEFHTFVYEGPMFRQPVRVTRGEIVERDGFWFCDLLP